MQLPELPPLPPKPILQKYILFSIGALVVILGLTFWIGYQTRLNLIYVPTEIKAVIKDPQKLNEQTVSLTGTYIPYSAIKKPICVPIGKKQYPELVPGYKELPASWGIYDGTNIVAVKIINTQGNEMNQIPNYSFGKEITLKGKLHSTTSIDDCNLDIQYPSVYLEIAPSEVGLKEK